MKLQPLRVQCTRAWNIFLSWKVRTPPSQAPLVKKEGMFLYAWFILCS